MAAFLCSANRCKLLSFAALHVCHTAVHVGLQLATDRSWSQMSTPVHQSSTWHLQQSGSRAFFGVDAYLVACMPSATATLSAAALAAFLSCFDGCARCLGRVCALCVCSRMHACLHAPSALVLCRSRGGGWLAPLR
jgi:hypothetical protein